MTDSDRCAECGAALEAPGTACPSCGVDSAATRLEPRSRPPEARGPERLGEFRILRLLGRGGMGAVYEAEQEG